MLLFTNWGDFHGGLMLTVMAVWLILCPFVLSMSALLNLKLKFRNNRVASLLSFTLLPLIFYVLLIYYGGVGQEWTIDVAICGLPYFSCLIISYIILRYLIKKEKIIVANNGIEHQRI
jgi:hypothetical protein